MEESNEVSVEEMILMHDPLHRALWALGIGTKAEGSSAILIEHGDFGSIIGYHDVRLLEACLRMPEQEVPRVLTVYGGMDTTTSTLSLASKILEARLSGRRFDEEQVVPLRMRRPRDSFHSLMDSLQKGIVSQGYVASKII